MTSSNVTYIIFINKKSSHTCLLQPSPLQSYNNQQAIIFSVTLNLRRIASPIQSDLIRSDPSNPMQVLLMAILRAEATFSRYEMASKKQPLPKTVQISFVHAQNSSRDSQATGSSSLCEFRGNQNCENYLRTTLLELSFCFSALPPLVLSILAEKHFLGSSFLEKYYYVTNFSKSCLLSGELNSNWQFFLDYYRSNYYTHVKEVFQPEQEIIIIMISWPELNHLNASVKNCY